MRHSIQLLCALLLFCGTASLAQLKPVTIEEKLDRNRLNLYAVNHNDQDLDVLIKVSGTGFRQPGGRDRFFRVPAASKVLIQTLVVERGATPRYTYDLTVNEKLSKRVVRKPAERIKIDPPMNVLVYQRAGCERCEALIGRLDSSYYNYRKVDLDDDSKVRAYVEYQLSKDDLVLDSITNPVISLGGVIRTDIADFEALLKSLKEGKGK